MVSCFTFRSFMHFEFIFVYGVRKWSRGAWVAQSVKSTSTQVIISLFVSFSLPDSVLTAQNLEPA